MADMAHFLPVGRTYQPEASPTGRFKIGDIVRLASGGPKMTVTDLLPGGKIKVDWFDDLKIAHFNIFADVCLVPLGTVLNEQAKELESIKLPG